MSLRFSLISSVTLAIVGENDGEIIELAKGWYERGIKEAIYNRGLDPSINRHIHVCQNQLFSVWNQTIYGCNWHNQHNQYGAIFGLAI